MRQHPVNRRIITEALDQDGRMASSSSSSSSSSSRRRRRRRRQVPRGLAVLVRVLKAFVALQSQAGVLTTDSAAPVLLLIEELESHEAGAEDGIVLQQRTPTSRSGTKSNRRQSFRFVFSSSSPPWS